MDRDLLWMALMELGTKSGCHQRAERSFTMKNYQFPLCARCTGILLSSPVGYIWYIKKKLRMLIGVLLLIPMTIDGTIQLINIRESTNTRRLFTGMLGGMGLVFVRLNFYRMILHVVKR